MEGEGSPYRGREQAWVKHQVLRRYLQRLVFKVGQFQPGTTLNYIDGFSGPWDAVAEDENDSSPAIAIEQLTQARGKLAVDAAVNQMRVRAMFVEKNRRSYERLEELCGRAREVEAVPIFGEFEEQIDRARGFASVGPHPFAFIFIDPTGWTGFALKRIAPLLRVKPSEVLINFMLKDISRFIDDEHSVAALSFAELFGQDAAALRSRWRALSGLDREDEIVRTYCERVRHEGRFSYCASTLILNPIADRSHYHLVFATRSLHGLATFREIERSLFAEQKMTRAAAKQRRRDERSDQLALLAPDEMDTDYLSRLRARYSDLAREAFDATLSRGEAVAYDGLLAASLSYPMVSVQTVKTWIKSGCDAGRLEVIGLADRETVPKLRSGHRLRRTR